jgi:hypothetical protein
MTSTEKQRVERASARIARNAKPRERNVRDELDKRVAAYGGVTRAMSYLGRVGCPDVLALFPKGVFDSKGACCVWVETKQTSGRVKTLQGKEHKVLQAAGQDVRVIVTRADLDAWLPPR